ncbi:MAG: PilZ domain-containing protein [Spirochaetales bacterium]|nr:PilZ domain-containing protein [Spirochaetales bacterium]
MWILFIILFIGLVVAIVFLNKAGGLKFPWIAFYTKGRESGFSVHEINLLRKVAVENRLENPISLFWSIKQLDRCIRGTIIRFRSEGNLNEPENANFILKLYEFRSKVEMELPKYKLGIKSSRKLPVHQRLTVTLPGIGTYSSQIVENLRRYIAVSYPEGPTLPPGFSWKGQRIQIYFWRIDDAGYIFESKVLEDFSEQQYPILHVAHSDDLVRSQKRSSVRVEVKKPAFLYPLKTISQANEEEEKQVGLRCRLQDVSAGGAAVIIGGRAKVGLAVKIQFSLGSNTIAMCGTVKGVTFDQKRNQSILHIQSVELSPRTRNMILSYVYNIFGERETKTQKAATS